MRAMDVMTTDVITVDPDTTVQAVAALLAEHGISGAPVVDSGGRLVGIISEGDLLHRAVGNIGWCRHHRVDQLGAAVDPECAFIPKYHRLPFLV